MKLILSTSNILGDGSSAYRRPTSRFQKSNTEFTSALTANFAAAQQDSIPETNGDVPHTNGHTEKRPPKYQDWTTTEQSTVFIPSLDFTDSGLSEERSQYEITVKLFFLANQPASCRCAQTREAIRLVLQELHVPSIDLLIISYPGIAFDAEDEDGYEDHDHHCATQTHNNNNGDPALHADAKAEDVDTMVETWECLEEHYDAGVIARLGVAEFGKERLSRFLRKTRVRPSVDQINVRDCCVVPKPLIMYAREQKIELLTHSDCTNILPTGTLREMLGHGNGNGAGVLASNDGESGIKGNVEPQWVIKYTAVVKDRGVIENKGYFASAEIRNAA